LRARLVFENDSVTNIAHQLGYFETIASWALVPSIAGRLDAVTLDQVAAVAATRLTESHRTVGWFKPVDGAGDERVGGRPSETVGGSPGGATA